jgi:DNA-binding XRE family transcriptional regulator
MCQVLLEINIIESPEGVTGRFPCGGRREGQVENSLFWRRKKGVCFFTWDCETKRTTAGRGYSHCGSADGAAWTAAGRKKEMTTTTRWKRFYQKQMEDAKLRELVESELENLQLGVQIAKLRAEENLSQTKLAAKAEMSAPKISAMENEPRNLTIGTLIRVAHALDSRVEIKLVRRKGRRRGSGAGSKENMIK